MTLELYVVNDLLTEESRALGFADLRYGVHVSMILMKGYNRHGFKSLQLINSWQGIYHAYQALSLMWYTLLPPMLHDCRAKSRYE